MQYSKFTLPPRKASVYPKNLGDSKLKTRENLFSKLTALFFSLLLSKTGAKLVILSGFIEVGTKKT